MDALRTLLLARAHVVALDPDRVADAATRPARDNDLDKFEDELAQLGFVMSLDLAMAIRRLPYQAMQELRSWMSRTLGAAVGPVRPHVPPFRGGPDGTPDVPQSLYRRRVLTWLLAHPTQPCPWCGQSTTVGSLDPCGHLVCRACWSAGSFAGCPICHRRSALGEPFVTPIVPLPPAPAEARLGDGRLRLVHLAFDALAFAKERFGGMLARATPLSRDDRAEVEAVIDMLGPKAVNWLPARMPLEVTAAVVVARLWLVSPDRTALRALTVPHVRTATDVLRIAVVLMGGDPGLAPAGPLRSLPRGLRRTVLEALDALPAEAVLDDVRRHPGVWKRVGERLHPYEHAARLPTAALAFATVRRTSLTTTSFGAALTTHAAPLARVRIADGQVRVAAWAAPIEAALRAGDAAAAAAHLVTRPAELLRRADHVVRTSATHQPAALDAVLALVRAATPHGAPATLLTLAAHVARRDHAWPRRVFLPGAQLARAWGAQDVRPPLPAAAIAAIIAAAHDELLRRAGLRRPFARAVIDRGLADLLVPVGAAGPAAAGPAAAPLDVFLQGAPPRGSAAARTRLARDFADLASTGARPTLLDLAGLHAAARANVIYVRERDGRVTQVRRRDGESTRARLARLRDAEGDGSLAGLPAGEVPTWFAVLRDDLTIPASSEGLVLDAHDALPGLTRLTPAALLAQLVP